MPRNTAKQTKKFITKRLKDTIDRRKQFAKVKQRHQVTAKRKARKVADRPESSQDAKSDSDASEDPKTTSLPNLKDMSMDDFFQGGFAVVQENIANGKKSAKSGSGSKLGKRKRDAKQAEEDLSSESDGNEQIFEEEDESVGAEDEGTESDTDQVATHKDQLSALAEKDPEFYKYLKDNDAELLDFAAGGDTLILSEDESDRPRKKSKSEDAENGDTQISISVSVVRKWAAAMSQQHSQAAMREAILAFRAAAHSNEEEGKTFKYTITDAETFHQILVTALKEVPAVLAHHLPIKESASGKVKVPTDSKKFKTFSPMLNSHAISITHLLESLPDAKAINMVVASLEPMLPYFLSFKKSLKNLIKSVINVWATPSSSEIIRVNAFLLLKRLAVIGDASLREAVFKSTYQGLVRGARNTTVHTLPGINLMKNSAAELWGLDPGLAYTTGFTYIRQLAIHLRTSITQPSKENYKAVYNWQYVHSLDFWSRVLSRNCSPEEVPTLKKSFDSPLHPLIYPLVQVTLGALRLVPSPVYFPLRFHLARSLLRISRTTNTFIPLAPALLEVLQSPEMKKSSKNSTLKPLDFDVVVRAPESYLRTRIYQDGIAEQLSELIAEFFGVWAKNIAFPELVIPPMTVIKRWLKEVSSYGQQKKGSTNGRRGSAPKSQGNRNGKANAHFSLLVQKLQANATFVESRRRKVDFAVNDRQGVESFLRDTDFEDTPLGSYVMTLRRQKEERDRVLQESREEDERKRKESLNTGIGTSEASLSAEESEEASDDGDEEDEEDEEDEKEESD